MSISNQHLMSIHVSNSVGAPSKPPLLVISEYEHWKSRMQTYIDGKERGEEMWRSITQGPHVIDRARVDNVAAILGNNEAVHMAPTPLDLEKQKADRQAKAELVCGIPPSLYGTILVCKTTKEIWDRLEALLQGSKSMTRKKAQSAVDAYESFTIAPDEELSSSQSRFSICIDNLEASGLTRTPMEYNSKYINALGPEWATIKSLLTSNGDMDATSIFIFFDAIKGHVENVKAAQTAKLGGPLALVSTTPAIQSNEYVESLLNSQI